MMKILIEFAVTDNDDNPLTIDDDVNPSTE